VARLSARLAALAPSFRFPHSLSPSREKGTGLTPLPVVLPEPLTGLSGVWSLYSSRATPSRLCSSTEDNILKSVVYSIALSARRSSLSPFCPSLSLLVPLEKTSIGLVPARPSARPSLLHSPAPCVTLEERSSATGAWRWRSETTRRRDIQRRKTNCVMSLVDPVASQGLRETWLSRLGCLL
jgi:hypothetical protein